METSTTKRDYLLDNYKVLLITLVVVGHFIDAGSSDNGTLYVLKWLIFAFHMPAFIFISGYFSKKEVTIQRLCRTLLVPYLVFEVLYYILYTFIIHKDTELYLLYPKFSLWYLLALFVWKLITPWVMKIPGHMVLAFVASLWVGCSNLDDNFLTLPRMITFYPFFLVGVHFQRQWISLLREKIGKIPAAVAFMGANGLVLWLALGSGLSEKIFYGRYNYDYLKLTTIEGILVRVMTFVIALLMTFALLVLLSDRENRLSYLGARTMAVYLFHGLVFTCFKQGKSFYSSLGNPVEILIILGASILAVWLLSREPFMRFVDFIQGRK